MTTLTSVRGGDQIRVKSPAVIYGMWLLISGLAQVAVAQNDLRDIPDADPEFERQSFVVADGFEVNLFASDPQMAKPIHMNFDDRGRLWIASSEVYPQIMPGQKASDKILVIEDVDQDGRADKTTTFADGLLIPTGVLPTDGGCYVANSTELVRFHDVDGDGKADRQEIVLSGFGTEDTHHLLHTLQWGPDAALYMNQSIYIHSHVETPYGVKHLNGGGIWRYEPATLRLGILCKGFVNPWGHQFDQWGQSFATDGAYREGINYVFPGSVFVTSPDARRIVAGLNPGSPKHCGLEIASGSHLPDDWQDNMFTNDFRAHRVCRFVVTRTESGYMSRQKEELIKTEHVAFRPIDVKMGPDGAIYVADWYNPIIQHGEVDFRDPRRDHTHGRIWRIVARNRPLVERVDFESLSVEQLVDLLESPERWNRTFAKRRLTTHEPSVVEAATNRWLSRLDRADPQFEQLRLEALWLQQAIGQIDIDLLNELATSDDPHVRAAAVRVASVSSGRIDHALAFFRRAVDDVDWQVRLEGVRGLANVPQPEAANLALSVLERPLNSFLDFALWQTMNDLASVWLPLVERNELDFDGDVERLTFALKAVESPNIVQPLIGLFERDKIPQTDVGEVMELVVSLGNADQLSVVFQYLLQTASSDPVEAERLLTGLARQQQERKIRPDADLDRLSELLLSEHVPLRAAAARAAGIWRVKSLHTELSRWASTDDEMPVDLRRAAIDALASLGGDAIRQLGQIAEESASLELRSRAILGLSRVDPTMAADLAAQILSELQRDDDPEQVIRGFLAQKQGQSQLAAALADVQLDPNVGKRAIRTVQASAQPSESLINRLRDVAGLSETVWRLTPELSQQLVRSVATRGDAARGELVYRRQDLKCLDCHAIGGSGGDVGPDMVSIGASAQVDYLVESLLAPNDKIKENFHSKTLITIDGQIMTGIPIGQSDGFLSLRQGDGTVLRIQSSDIEEMTDGPSLMPEGLVDSLTEDELADLIRFLSELGKVGKYSLPNRQLARTWQSLVWTEEGNHRLNRTSFDTAATDDQALSWQDEYSRVDGQLPIQDLAKFTPHKEVEPTSFVRCWLDAREAGEVVLLVNGTAGLSFWLDGKPTPIDDEILVALTPGRHQLTYAINHSERSAPLVVELEPGRDSTTTETTFQLKP